MIKPHIRRSTIGDYWLCYLRKDGLFVGRGKTAFDAYANWYGMQVGKEFK